MNYVDKFQLSLSTIHFGRPFAVRLPPHSEPLQVTLDEQDLPCLWARVWKDHANSPGEDQWFIFMETRQHFPAARTPPKHVGTFLIRRMAVHTFRWFPDPPEEARRTPGPRRLG